jgi:hypothetical protein
MRFGMLSVRVMSSGDQVYDSYGRKCNSRFFVNYGFALEDNEDNQCVIPLEISPKDTQYQMKLRFLGGHHSSTRRRFQIPIQYKEKVRYCGALTSLLLQPSPTSRLYHFHDWT